MPAFFERWFDGLLSGTNSTWETAALFIFFLIVALAMLAVRAVLGEYAKRWYFERRLASIAKTRAEIEAKQAKLVEAEEKLAIERLVLEGKILRCWRNHEATWRISNKGLSWQAHEVRWKDA